MRDRSSAHDLAYCGLFGAAALLLPVIFHLVRLGHVFMPMYLPLMTLAFFVPPRLAAATALIVPVLSGAVTGMPPFYPPVAVFMSIELAIMSGLVAAVMSRRPKTNEWLVLVPVLLFGRALYVALVFAFSLAIELPARFMAGLSLLGGWPGILLMIAVVPPVARLRKSPRLESPGSPIVPPQRSSQMIDEAKAAYFDSIAGKWDGWEDLPSLAAKLGAGLEELGVGPNETILDVGCGTGNLILALLARLSSAGRVAAVDIASRMIEEAGRKIRDPRVEWHIADVRRLPLQSGHFDRAFCFSVWPHIDDPGAAVEELCRVLKPGGYLHIWHLSSRHKITEVHASTDGPIHHDVLQPAAVTANLLKQHGFLVTTVVDDSERYLVTAVRPGGRDG
jgi:ubiquinone/menaquinone biosynthesis C-methylase UbiE